MKEAVLLVIRKPHQGEEVVENVLNYMLSSCFADIDEMITFGVSNTSYNQMISDIHNVQSNRPMENHRAIFHMVLSTRPSKVSQKILDEGAYVLMDYSMQIGHQVVMVPHYGSEQNCDNYHYHIALNPISLNGERLHDKWETFNNMTAYLNAHTRNNWSWAYTTPNKYKKYF